MHLHYSTQRKSPSRTTPYLTSCGSSAWLPTSWSPMLQLRLPQTPVVFLNLKLRGCFRSSWTVLLSSGISRVRSPWPWAETAIGLTSSRP